MLSIKPETSVQGHKDGSFCKKYNSCNVPFCPILGGIMVKGERKVCLYLAEAVKEGGKEMVRSQLAPDAAEIVIEKAFKILEGDHLPHTYDLHLKVKRSATGKSRLACGFNLAQNSRDRAATRASKRALAATPATLATPKV